MERPLLPPQHPPGPCGREGSEEKEYLSLLLLVVY